MDSDFQSIGTNPIALFTLKLHRGEGMVLIAMDWKKEKPPNDFVGFAIEFKEPGKAKFFVIRNRIAFPDDSGNVNPNTLSSRFSPIQAFRWIHFPRNAWLNGEFIYKVTPVFMNELGELSYGDEQEASIELRRETYPGQINITFTRGFMSSQAFVKHYGSKGDVSTLLPAEADLGLGFVPSHPKYKEALAWMGFEARYAILELLDEAINDQKAQVRVVAYDLNEPEIVSRLEKLGGRLKIIIDDDGPHKEITSCEFQAEKRLVKSAGRNHVKRQHMGKLQHNKTIVVDGPKVKAAVCGSTNLSWRGFFVQANNAVVLKGEKAIQPFVQAFENYWNNDKPAGFSATGSARWIDLGFEGIDAHIGFSPYNEQNAVLNKIADDISNQITSSLLYSLAFLYQTPGVILAAIKKVTNNENIFVYGISDKDVGGIELQKPDGNVEPVSSAALEEHVPEPFKSEPTGGRGNRMHHKFVVIDFNKPTARVYFGSYNFSVAADSTNGENLVVIRDQRIATAYAIEALRIFDHYHFRVAQKDAAKAKKKLILAKPPQNIVEKAWWDKYFTDSHKIRDRELFA